MTLLYFMWVAKGTNHRNEITAIINTDIGGLEDAYRIGGIEAVVDILHYRLKNPEKGKIYLLADEAKHVLLGNFAYIPAAAQREDMFEFTLPIDAQNTGLPPDRSYNIMAVMHSLPNGYALLVGRNIPDTKTNSIFVGRLGWAMILILASLAAAGFFIGDRVVYRINLIADTASQIMQTGDLSRRIPVPGKWDDLSVLAHILNELFERVESLVIGVREVSDNVAHDLRTPLTRIKNRLESLHSRGESEQLPITECTEKLIAESDHLLATFSALLRIGNIESGKWQGEVETIRLHRLIEDVVEFYEPLASDKQQTIHMSLARLSLDGDKHLLFQAIANLLDNAIKYTPDHGDITVTLKLQNGLANVSVTDSGKGVPEEDCESIFRRFYRTDKARNKSGNGLGLSLVKAIIELHKGTIRAYRSEAGFTITMTLPVN